MDLRPPNVVFQTMQACYHWFADGVLLGIAETALSRYLDMLAGYEGRQILSADV
jgi:hypothetical protein